ncbi:adenylate/guanylate cyclase domain-containing protein [Microbacterium sp. kSW2-24]|uniref:adenylate/guanylate cyclase domain-containing protein n=1 Tax=Microbacterium galbinum TaxID=2851646 RepID=UPI001FFC4254|nr:adenylate/guanylate cyclase domain-containing protein [Microbacterium galbinum]MCK2023278.1 adenylate/guanylate cyclase domain-containing protein [Microbacterium galbinum]
MSEQGTVGEKTERRLRRLRPGLSIQSKLLIMLLAVSLVSSVIVGAVGFINGRQSLHDAAVDQLITIRSMRAAEVTDAIEAVKKDASLQSRNLSAQTLSTTVNAGYEELEQREVTADERAQLESYYSDTFIPALEGRAGEQYGDSAFIPESNAGQFLQTRFTTQNLDFDADYDTLLNDNDAEDGSSYSAATERYGDYLGRLIEQADYEDALLLNLDGDIVFSAYKGVELGSNLNTGPYRDTMLAQAYADAIATNSVSTVVLTDFERWIPSLNVPTMWVVSPIGNDSRITGALALQVSLETINDLTTGSEGWKEQGLGDTGEVYLVGLDDLMRSDSRRLIEDPENYEQLAIDGGTPPSVAKRIVEVQGTVLLQPINTRAVAEAQAGRTGTTTGPGYLGIDSVTAYAPLEVDGLDWVIIARIDSSEAFAPVADFTRIVLLSLLGILLGVSLLSLLLAQVFTRPIHRLVGAVHRVAEGDLDVQVPQGARDEFGDLGSAFNDMASSLRIKQELIDEQQAENEKLLLTLMPESVAAKYKQGDETISEAHENVSVVFAELVGFDDYARGLSAEQEIGHLNTLMRGFDEAAEKAGVEKVRTLRGGYLASSGLIVPRVDNVRRSVEFAKNLLGVIERFNAQNGSSIGLRAGVDTGTVTSGLVARTSLAYDLWGDAVNLAYRVRSVTGEPGVYVSQTVYDRTREIFSFTEAGTVEARGTTETVWKVA